LLTGLHTFDIGKCERLKELPDSVCELTNLTRLDIWDCAIEKLPTPAFGRMMALQELILQELHKLTE